MQLNLRNKKLLLATLNLCSLVSAKSLLKTQDHEWYFFSALNHKGKNKSANGRGYWKVTGKSKAVKHNACVVGSKRILVFYYGRGPDQKRTNWVMHEYRLVEEEMDKCGIGKVSFLCDLQSIVDFLDNLHHL